MSSAKELEVALYYLQSECYKAGFPEPAYLIEMARLSLEDAEPVVRPEPALPSNVIRLWA